MPVRICVCVHLITCSYVQVRRCGRVDVQVCRCVYMYVSENMRKFHDNMVHEYGTAVFTNVEQFFFRNLSQIFLKKIGFFRVNGLGPRAFPGSVGGLGFSASYSFPGLV